MHGIYAMDADTLEAARLRANEPEIRAPTTLAVIERELERRQRARTVTVEVRDAA